VTGTAGDRSLADWVREGRRVIAWHRRLVAAALLAAAIALALQSLASPGQAGTTVLVAAHDIAGGTILSAADLRTRTVSSDLLPAGVLTPSTSPQGRLLAVPVRAGEVLTDVRLLGRAALRGYGPGLVAAPVRIADSGVAELLRPGDRVDVLAAAGGRSGGSAPPGADVVAASVRVVTVPRQGSSALGGGGPVDGSLVVLATTPEASQRLTAAAAAAPLSVTIDSP
jgi:pilus assembly protein CpaB